MNLVYIKAKVINSTVAYPSRIIQFNNIIPIKAELDSTNYTIITFNYECKCLYTKPKCIDIYMNKHPYVMDYFYTALHGERHIKTDYIEHIYITNVDSADALLTNRYRLFNAITQSFSPDGKEFDINPLQLRIAPYKYHNRNIYEEVIEWIASINRK